MTVYSFICKCVHVMLGADSADQSQKSNQPTGCPAGGKPQRSLRSLEVT